MNRILFGHRYKSYSSWTNKEEAKIESAMLRNRGYRSRTVSDYVGWTVLKGPKRNQ